MFAAAGRYAADEPQAPAHERLRARVDGVQVSFLNQPIQVPALRPKLRALSGGEVPQLLLRMGYRPEAEPSPRRPPEDVLIGSFPPPPVAIEAGPPAYDGARAESGHAASWLLSPCPAWR